jgi:iron complex transport system ATP-binding protein
VSRQDADAIEPSSADAEKPSGVTAAGSGAGTASETVWEIDAARFAFGPCELFRDISLTMARGELWAMLGPNAVGKTTLLHAMLGLHGLTGGAIRYRGTAPRHWERRAFAREVALLPQREDHAFAMCARDVVALGRFSHQRGWTLGWSADDLGAAQAALARVELTHLADAPFGRLSGGERQLVLLARCLAQDPSALLLDEPTASLDPAHQLQLLRMARAMADEGRAVLMVVHDVNHAARWADHVALMARGRLVASGPTDSVLTVDRLADVYGIAFDAIRRPNGLPYFVART